jgi:hypothetical protein
MERFAECFTDYRDPDRIEHSVLELLRQRVYCLAAGYEDLNDHDDLMRDMLLAIAVGKLDVDGSDRRREQDQGKPLASSSTLNRFELTPPDATESARYKKIVYHPERIETLLVDLFMDSFEEAPEEIILDFDATDDPIHGEQEGRFFHGYYKNYCYLPLYVTSGKHVLVAKLRSSNIDACEGTVESLDFLTERIRQRWPQTRIILRADSGFARDEIMAWCEAHGVLYVLGLPKNSRLLDHIRLQMYEAKQTYESSKAKKISESNESNESSFAPARVFTEFRYRTQKTWCCSRRVIAKAEHMTKGANPRFIVTNISGSEIHSRELYEDLYCARGEMENRIKEQQLDLFADRTSAHTMRANQLRLWLSTFAYTLLNAFRAIGLKDTRLAKASCGTIRLKLIKIGAQVVHSVRRLFIRLAQACPYQDVFEQAWLNLRACPLRC